MRWTRASFSNPEKINRVIKSAELRQISRFDGAFGLVFDISKINWNVFFFFFFIIATF